MNTIVANLKHAARNHEVVTIGGGHFGPDELREVARQLEHREKLISALNLIQVDKDGDGFVCREAMEEVAQALSEA